MRTLMLVLVSFLVVFSGMTPFHAFATPHNTCATSTLTTPTTATAGQAEILSATAGVGVLFINEVLPAPGTATRWNCSDTTQNYSWIEIYNSGDQAYDLYQSHATLDTGPNTKVMYFPIGTTIAARGFLVFFPGPRPLFTSTISATLRLMLTGTIIDQVTFPPNASFPQDQSYARTTDGGKFWATTIQPTIGTSNDPPLATPSPSPSPASGPLIVSGTPPIIRATPTKLAAAKRTATARASKAGAVTDAGGIGGTDGANTGGGMADNATPSEATSFSQGVQPTWSALRLPDGATPAPTIDESSDTSPSPAISPPATNTDMPARFFQTGGVLALLLLVSGSWLFLRRHKQRIQAKTITEHLTQAEELQEQEEPEEPVPLVPPI